MIRRFLPLLITAGVITLTSCRPAFNVVNVNEAVPGIKGVYYSLPQTIITVDVTVTAKEYVKGPYAAYAGKYLGLNNVQSTSNISYRISDVKLGTYVEPDSSHFYLIEAKSCILKAQTPLMVGLSESGIIQFINDNNNEEFRMNAPENRHTAQTGSAGSFIQYSGTNIMEKIDTIFEKVTQDSVTFEKQILKKTLVEKTLEQKAADAADFIIKISEARFNLLSGIQEINYSKESLEFMNKGLEQLEKEYLELFTGVTKTSVTKHRYFFTPSYSTPNVTVPLFRFSTESGLMDLSDSRGQLVFLEVIKQGRADAVNRYLQLEVKRPEKHNGIYYRIPETARVSLIIDTDVKADAFMPVAQLGAVAKLPLLKNHRIGFCPNTGAIRFYEIRK